MVRFRTCLVIAVSACILSSAMVAEAGKKGESGRVAFMKYAAAQIPNSQKAATRAKSALASAVGEVRAAGQALQYATEELDRAIEQLEQAEKAAFRKVGDDHPFWESWSRYEEARDKYQAATQQALSSEVYQAALAEAKSSANYADLMADLRAQTLEEDPTIRKWRTDMRIAKDAVEAARRGIVDGDPQWAAGAFAVRSARLDVKQAENALDDALKKRLATRSSFNKAARAVAIGAASKQRLQYEKKLNQSSGKKKGGPSKKKKGGSKKKKKKY